MTHLSSRLRIHSAEVILIIVCQNLLELSTFAAHENTSYLEDIPLSRGPARWI